LTPDGATDGNTKNVLGDQDIAGPSDTRASLAKIINVHF